MTPHNEQRVSYERSPADFLAYLLAIDNLGRNTEASPLIDRSIPIVREATRYLVIVTANEQEFNK